MFLRGFSSEGVSYDFGLSPLESVLREWTYIAIVVVVVKLDILPNVFDHLV